MDYKVHNVLKEIASNNQKNLELNRELLKLREKCEHDWNVKFTPECGPDIDITPIWTRTCSKCELIQTTLCFKAPPVDYEKCEPLWTLEAVYCR